MKYCTTKITIVATEMEESINIAIIPSRESLLKRPGPIKCTEKNCTNTFASQSHLNMHLAKKHGMQHLLQKDSLKKQYYCPEKECSYHKKLHFKQFKLLKQHYLKVHAEKCYVCKLCSKGFPSELALKNHVEYCGAIFKCNGCSNSYSSYEALQTHCRRKKHVFYNKEAFRTAKTDLTVSKTNSEFCTKSKLLLLPKPSNACVILVTSKQSMDKTCQTDIMNDVKKQTSVETQTVGDYTQLKQKNNDGNERISTETQTEETKSFNIIEKLNMNDYCYGDIIGLEQKHSSTQTNINKNDNSLCGLDFDTTFFNCNTETQTDLFSDAILNNCEFYSNMCTQTPSCGDVLLDNLEFNDTYTQTILYDDDDVVRSVESQTLLYNNYKKGVLLSRDVVNIETQTDLEVKHIFEEMD